MRLSWSVLLPTIIIVSGFFVVVAGMVFRVQITRPKTGSDGLVGETGVVRQKIDPEGKVFAHGELWNAVSAKPIAEGTKVRILRVNNLVLEVESIEPND
jgi:membrane-bound serine protease (ClpP class)